MDKETQAPEVQSEEVQAIEQTGQAEEGQVKEGQVQEEQVKEGQVQEGQKSGQPEQVQETEKPGAEAPEKTKTGETIWNGNPEELPEEMRPKGKEMLRYFTKRSQNISELEKKAKWVDNFVNTGEWNRYSQWRQGSNVQPKTTEQSYTEKSDVVEDEELEDVYSNPAKLKSYVNKIVNNVVSKKEQVFTKEFSQLRARQEQIDSREQIEDFAKINPKFWDYYDDDLAETVVRDMVDTKGKTLQEAYAKMQSIENKILSRNNATKTKRVQEKMGAVSQKPGGPSDSQIVWVDSHDAARAMTTTLVMENSDKVVRVRNKAKEK